MTKVKKIENLRDKFKEESEKAAKLCAAMIKQMNIGNKTFKQVQKKLKEGEVDVIDAAILQEDDPESIRSMNTVKTKRINNQSQQQNNALTASNQTNVQNSVAQNFGYSQFPSFQYEQTLFMLPNVKRVADWYYQTIIIIIDIILLLCLFHYYYEFY
jgi:hypothetical protein